MNTIACKNCVHFDEQFRNLQEARSDGSRAVVRKSLWYGWCSVKSVYPAQEQDGQIFPLDVERREVEEQKLAKPHCVDKNKVLPHCTQAIKKDEPIPAKVA
jgi:hypothetical protein